MYDVIIIGGGPAGLSAGMYSGRLMMKTLVLAGIRGGTIVNASEIKNWPGITSIEGLKLAKQLEEHAKEYVIDIKDATATAIKKQNGAFVVTNADGENHEAKSIIIATGTEVRKLGIKGESEYANKGVHYCALCDGFFYTNKTVAVIGGSDSAVKEALVLAQWAKKVYIIYRKDKLRAEPVNLEKLKSNKKIEVIANTNVVEIKGDGNLVTQLLLDREYFGTKTLAVDGVFVEIGRVPNSGFAKYLSIALNEKGEIITDKKAKTNVDGVFAAGDVTDSSFKQAITASADGVIAAFGAYEYVKNKSTQSR